MQITTGPMGIRLKWLLVIIIPLLANIVSSAVPHNLAEIFLNRQKDSSVSFIFNRTNLLDILSKLNYLSICLNRSLDLQNNLIQFLLKQKICPLQIFVGSIDEHQLDRINMNPQSELKFYIPPKNFAVAIEAENLHTTTLLRYASKDGYMLCLIFGNLNILDLEQYAEDLWKDHRIYRVYYFTSEKSWFYNPFALVKGTDRVLGGLVNANQFSMECIFDNMNGYIVRVYIFDSAYSRVFGNLDTKTITSAQGADSEAALLLSEKLNFTIAFQWPDDEFFGARLENGSYDGAIGRLIRSEADIAMSGFFVKDYLTREISFTVSVYMDELCCYVMKARRVPQSILPLFAVRLDIWIGFFLVGLICPLMWMLMRYMNLLLTNSSLIFNYHAYAEIFSDTWIIWVRSTLNRFPIYHSERIFVASLCLVSVIYGALFESSLATVYIHPLFYKDINTLQELDDAGFRIYIKHAAMKDDLFYGYSSPLYQNLNRKLLLVAEMEDRLINLMSKRGGFAAVTRASSLDLDDIRYLVTKKIHKIPECPKNYHIAFVLPRQSPFEEVFNNNLLFFLQAGLIDKWINAMKHEAKSKMYTFPDYTAERENYSKVLTLRDLQLAFYALASGCTLAFLTLIGERILRRRSTRRIFSETKNILANR